MIEHYTFFKCEKCDKYYHMYSVELDSTFVEAYCPECGNNVVGVPENLENQVPLVTKTELADIEASFDTPDDFIDEWLYEVDDTPDYDDIAFQQMCYDDYF